MATDYKESTIAGKKWQRTRRVIIENEFAVTPSILFVEEEAVNTGSEVITRTVANLSNTFDPNKARHVQIYALLDEEYTELREARDAA